MVIQFVIILPSDSSQQGCGGAVAEEKDDETPTHSHLRAAWCYCSLGFCIKIYHQLIYHNQATLK